MEDSTNPDSPETSRQPIADSPRRGSKLAFSATGLAALVAFRSVLGAPIDWSKIDVFEEWFFNPSQDSRSIAILVTVWLLWRGRKALASSGAPGVTSRHLTAAVAVTLFFGWATWWRAPLLLMLCLYFFGITLAAGWGGRAAVKAFITLCLALMVSMPPPNPVLSEIVWWLQGATANGAHALLSLAGLQIGVAGTELRLGEQVFAVVEACSGWRGISILLIISIVAANLNRLSLSRTLTLAALSIPLGLALNIARVAAVITTQQELSAEGFESHTPQGIAVLLVGSFILYATAAVLGFRDRRPIDRPDTEHQAALSVVNPVDSMARRRFRRFALSFALTLAFASILLPALSTMPEAILEHRRAPDFPLNAERWEGTSLDPNYYFPYDSGDHPQFHAEYRREFRRNGLEIVDLFIALETPEISGLNRLPDSKLLLPAGDWTIDSRENRRLHLLGADAQVAVVTRGDPRQLAYIVAWRVHDRGLWRESLASLIGMDACEAGRRRCARGVIRLAVPLGSDTGQARDRAQKTATQFMRSFQASLTSLSE